MSIVFQDDCVGCPPEMGCLGDTCKFKHVPHLYCDECTGEQTDLYDGLCIDCFISDRKMKAEHRVGICKCITCGSECYELWDSECEECFIESCIDDANHEDEDTAVRDKYE